MPVNLPKNRISGRIRGIMRHRFFLAWAVFFASAAALIAASTLPLSLEERTAAAKAIVRGTVVQNSCFRNPDDGGIYTRTLLRVDEALKGRFPEHLQVIHRGGQWGEEGEVDGFAPRFVPGEERVVFLDAREDGTLFAFDGSASAARLRRQEQGKAGAAASFAPEDDALLSEIRRLVPDPSAQGMDTTSQAGSPGVSVVGGLLTDGNGISSRFTALDRGEKIPYIVDAQALPSGISLSQALNAVSNALQAWSQVSSVQFVYEGTQNFGQAAPNVAINDGKIRIQLHDLYGYITGSTTLGIGGRNYSIPSDFPNGGMGGKVGGQEFFHNNRGYIVLKHTKTSMQTLSTFEEVLCHEIGHVLSLDHSSENASEPDTTLREAAMYYTVHADGRGASLGAYDPPKIRLVHPFNTPPFSYDRIMDIVTAPSTPNVAGINEVELRGYDLQGDSLTMTTTNATANYGSFSLVGSTLKFTPSGYFSDSAALDPASGLFYDKVNVRFSDGTHASPYIKVRVMRFYQDSKPGTGGGDGLPDSWMITHFGNADPAAGPNRSANADFDGDGISNLNEFRLGTSPIDANSALKVTSYSTNSLQFPARTYHLYEIQTSQDLSVWSRATNPIVPTSATVIFSNFPDGSPRHFRVLKVP